jgi:methyl-accepting chemotaxis protein PixJ
MTSHGSISANGSPILVALSLLIAVLASYSAVNLAGRVAAARSAARLAWLAGGAIALGGGIWAMHFTAMLAHVFPGPVGYDLPTVALSLLMAVAIAVPALYLGGGAELTLSRLLGGGALVSSGIITMHYTGMAALRQMSARRRPAHASFPEQAA